MATKTIFISGLIASSLMLGMFVGSSNASAEGIKVPTKNSLVEALLPSRTGPVVRGMDKQATRGIKILNELPKKLDLPAVNLTVNFEFDSARLTTEGMTVLRSLGQALSDDRLAGMRFQIAGHTDAKGNDDYNKELSEKRAKVVAEHLRNFYGIPKSNLVPVGYGEDKLLDETDPQSDKNRRVEIINLAPLS